MEREMRPIKAYLNQDNMVIVAQVGQYDEDDYVCLHPAQIPTLIQWLQELQEESEAKT